MSGHSKWSKIKRQKQANDVAKGALFSKLARTITLSVLEGGGITDPALNVSLRLAVEKARKENMPKDSIQRAIEKGVGPNKATLKEMQYEAFGPHGIALLIFATTDNPNRTVSEIRNTLEQKEGKVGAQGSVSYLFTRCGVVHLDKDKNSEDEVLQAVESIEAFDVEHDESSFTLYFPFENLGKINVLMKNLRFETPEIDYKPSVNVHIGEHEQESVIGLIEALDGLDDVQNVYTNAVFTS